ncbi:universal stress protein [Geodermatophilus sp. URMC 61]|uniref:universal stress protein n=1 Tax=Geodermatophilus sp. URMC 61 TaxID=3423411 RepID=UPI00406C5664
MDIPADVAPSTAGGTVVVGVDGGAGSVRTRLVAAADLLGLGGRGRGAVRGALLGSVARPCVVRASRPVLVVGPERSGVVVPGPASGVPARA